MGMPQVPERDCLPSMNEVVAQILESIALEELAMAHIMNAEGEKMQALVQMLHSGNICCDCIQSLFKSTNTTLNNLIMKEWIMFNKLNTALEVYQQCEESPYDPCRQPCPLCKGKGCTTCPRCHGSGIKP